MKLRGQGRNEALHPVLCREVVVGKPGVRNGVGKGSAKWNESGYSFRAVQPGLCDERADQSDQSR